jgi:HPt (histidine-containing phosphotransfer) domain-containing protein
MQAQAQFHFMQDYVRSEAAEEPVLDVRVLEKWRELGGDELVSELLDVFLFDAERRAEHLRRAAAEGDASAWLLSARMLKGSGANLGGNPLTSICERMEAFLKAGRVEDAKALMPDFEAAFTQVKEALEHWRPRR